MFRLHFLLIILTTLGMVLSNGIESNFYLEEPCAQVKGFCVLEKECPQQVCQKYKGLCPAQKEQGAICCPNFPADQVNCYQTHNECRDTCPKQLDIGQKGCPKKQTCCVLV